MSRSMIPVEEAAKEWFKDSKFAAQYEALEEEFAIAEASIKARCEKQDAKVVGRPLSA
ncbi:hypothetical protein [Mesorhizobium sp. M0088]|uniref:hypothetical protein n=1 Tax=Mesorhizobium sp. M0088 TaxID=2956873 RepID=UPI003336F541